MNDLVTLVLGTTAMLFMVIAIISFAFIFQRKFFRKQKEYSEIENLLKRQELKSAYALIEGQDQERKRIAADLHDNIGSMLATLKIYADLATCKPQDPELLRLNHKVNDLTDKLTTEIRKLSHSLDSGTLLYFGLNPAVAQLCEAISNTGKLKVSLINDLNGIFDQDCSLQIYRIIQELFTNTLKHARASVVRLEITQLRTEISIIYEDNGMGFNVHATPPTSLGLKTIQSRVQKLNGEMRIASSSRGSTFIFEIPITE